MLESRLKAQEEQMNKLCQDFQAVLEQLKEATRSKEVLQQHTNHPETRQINNQHHPWTPPWHQHRPEMQPNNASSKTHHILQHCKGRHNKSTLSSKNRKTSALPKHNLKLNFFKVLKWLLNLWLPTTRANPWTSPFSLHNSSPPNKLP